MLCTSMCICVLYLYSWQEGYEAVNIEEAVNNEKAVKTEEAVNTEEAVSAPGSCH